ncbi:MAG: aldehyde dehydrogenase family protein [Deltaproteobacteria bacterium]|nr:aldehyde dehydrogenase family protein [Deltaproteobacteria bacterium]
MAQASPTMDLATSRTLVSTNPATLERLGEVPITASADVHAAVARARAAQPTWAALSFAARRDCLLRAREYLLQHLDAFALTITQENGKPLVEALTAELYPLADLLYYFAHHTATLLRGESLPTGLMRLLGRTSRLTYRPVGVVGIIAPWNYPFSIPAGSVAMALMAGNSVVLKPSSATPLVGMRVAELFEAAQLPSDVFIHIPGDATTGQTLCETRLHKLIFTGSVGVGKKVMAACAQNLIPCVLELGGKDPMIVRADADLDFASSGAVWGAFTNAGQCCASVERVYVHQAVAERFIELVVRKTQQLRQGIGTNAAVEIGPLTTAAQLAIVERQVEEARARGAQILTGGERNAAFPGYFYRPTVLTNVDHSFAVMREETFGPLLPIMTFSDDREAVQLANDTTFGLTASVWSRDRTAAERMAKRIHAGTVTINDCLYTHAICQTPWGGSGESGFGRTHGKVGLMELVEPHHIHVNTSAPRKDLWWYPYGQRVYDLFRVMARTATGGWWQRLRSLPTLLQSLKLPKS